MTVKKSIAPVERLLEQGLVWNASHREHTKKGEHAKAGEVPQETTARAVASFGIPEIDSLLPLGGLPSGRIHDWTLEHSLSCKARHIWHPPLILINALLGNTLRTNEHQTRRLIVWVGRKCWPSPDLLAAALPRASYEKESQCLFVETPGKEKRLWTLTQALRNRSVFAVVGDASSLYGTATRRLQLAAEQGGALGIMLRPPWEQQSSSSAYSKWQASSLASSPLVSSRDKAALTVGATPRWSLELTRLRGTMRGPTQHPATTKWILEWSTAYGKGSLSLIKAAAPATEHTNVHASAL